MARIGFIGAGSVGFTRTLLKDVLTVPTMDGVTVGLMDTDPERLQLAKRSVERIVPEGGHKGKVLATRDRGRALRGADAVLCTVLAGAAEVWRYEIESSRSFGVDICVGDTRGPAGMYLLMTNLPPDCCLDWPICANESGFNPVPVGALPPQCAILTALTAAVEEMAVEGGLTGNREAIYHAFYHDPLTAAVLSLAEIRKMVDALFKKNEKYLSQFKS